jgi:osmotically-inducible protein OsmY
MRLIISLIGVAVMVTTLAGCAPVVVGGAAAGGAMAADRRTSGAYVEDQSIEIKAETQIANQLGDKVHINVISFNRNVLVTGEARDEEGRKKAEMIVKGLENVRNVTNEVVVGMISAMSSRVNDAYLTSKVKARMLAENKFPVQYVKVFTEDSVVFLMGMVTRKEAEQAVEIARNTEGVTKVVKVFEYVVEQ